jgi:hypothetical protein
MLQYQLHPYQAGHWTDPKTKNRKSSSVFRADWRNTLDLLERETDLLGIKGHVIIEVGAHDSDIAASRQNLVARASVGFDGVVVSFEAKQGPMRFACDAYCQAYSNDVAAWKANVRAVSLTLEALRAIDRWGAAQTGQQYTGWLALPAADGTTFPTADAALRWLQGLVKDLTGTSRRPLDVTAMTPGDLYREAARRLHPDTTTGSPELWARLQNARLLMQTAKMI